MAAVCPSSGPANRVHAVGSGAMALLSELDLPVLDYTDPDAARPALPRADGRAARAGLAGGHADRRHGARPRGGEFFLRSRATTFPGRKIAELFGIETGRWPRSCARNILCIDGDDHRRLRNLVNPAFTPRAADRWRPAMRALPRASSGRPCAATGAASSSSAFAKPYPSLVDRDGDGRAAHRRAAAARLVELDPAAVRRRGADDRARADRARPWSSSTTTPTRCSRARRDDPGDDLVSTLLAAEADGDRLSDVECVNLVLNVLIGGVDTTQSQLAHARAPARRASRPVGAAARRPARWPPRRSRRRCATSRSRRSPRASSSRTWSTAASLPRRHRRAGRRAARPTATAWTSPTRFDIARDRAAGA